MIYPEYTKIHTIWQRDPKGKIQSGVFSKPEFEFLKDCNWLFTEKVDGTNIRIVWDGAKVHFGGRTDEAMIHNGLVSYLRDTFTEEKFKNYFEPLKVSSACLYGEGYGAKIQAGGGNYKADGQAFALFDVLVDKWWLERSDIEAVAKAMEIKVVPLCFVGTLSEAEKKIQEGIISEWGNFKAEGLVGKPPVGLFNRRGERIIIKMKTKDYR